ncbi:hypothetical protein [Flavisolibacter tropicus]|uniref:Lipocalin-like domain-containing protein n=1 Tax=Flavisolibacter tropicus TaxID=1492898 RepID=A0A172TR86_9BACT|nr:hypothetical protein [Flavisolibacter tropicus]ANE49273.1 hypothetical protein SY85_00900 [Flavisolibacter tropicus]
MKPQPPLLALIAFLFLTACHKDDLQFIYSRDGIYGANEVFVIPTGEAAKILGKWMVNSITVKHKISTFVQTNNYVGRPVDYIDFRTDGKVYTFTLNNSDTSKYFVRSEKEITIDTDPATVKLLTANKLVLYSYDEVGSLGFTEVTYDLRK